MCKRWLGVLAAALTAACFGEIKPVDTTPGMDGTAADTVATDPGPTSTGPDADTEPGLTSTTAIEPTSTSVDGTATDDDSSSGEPLPILCGDGRPAPGELCFADTTVLMANDTTYGARVGDVSGTPAADVVHLIPDQVVVRVGDGGGNFGPAVFDASAVAERFELHDFDGDGELDMVVPETSGIVLLLRGSGAGSFSSLGSVLISADPRALGVGRIDGDAGLDIVVTTADAMLHVVRGDGTGNLSAPASMALAEPALGLGLADFDGDGATDLVVAGLGGVALLRGLGDGTFQGPEPTPGPRAGARAIAAADLDGDDQADVAYVSEALNTLGVLLGDGAGGFGPELVAPTGNAPQVLHAADLDGDGRAELVVGHQGETTLRVYVVEPGRGPLESLQIPLAAPVSAIHAGDVNDDGVPDLAATSSGAEIVTLVLSNP
jgi:FG-GAP-like repeat